METYIQWITRQLNKLGLDKAVCPHCNNDNQELMKENWYFTHAHHKALNYQCHNRPHCDKYFKIGPLSDCACGWNKEEAERQKQFGKEWRYEPNGGWMYRDIQ